MALTDYFHRMIERQMVTYEDLREEIVRQAFGQYKGREDITANVEALREAINLWIGDEDYAAPVTVGKYLQLHDLLRGSIRVKTEREFVESLLFADCDSDDAVINKAFKIAADWRKRRNRKWDAS